MISSQGLNHISSSCILSTLLLYNPIMMLVLGLFMFPMCPMFYVDAILERAPGRGLTGDRHCLHIGAYII